MLDQVDWRSVKNIFDILIADTKSWLDANYGAESIDKFKQNLIYKVDREFEKYPGGILLNHLIDNSV